MTSISKWIGNYCRSQILHIYDVTIYCLHGTPIVEFDVIQLEVNCTLCTMYIKYNERLAFFSSSSNNKLLFASNTRVDLKLFAHIEKVSSSGKRKSMREERRMSAKKAHSSE